jgi:RHS repeat-associated protein
MPISWPPEGPLPAALAGGRAIRVDMNSKLRNVSWKPVLWFRRLITGTVILSFPVLCVLAGRLGALSSSATVPQAVALQPDFAYTGLFYHQRSGLYFAQARAYDSGLKRWLNRDPIGEQGGINLYGYVANRPTIATDPTGLDSGTPAQPKPYPITPIEPERPRPRLPGPSPTPNPKQPVRPPTRKECESLN